MYKNFIEIKNKLLTNNDSETEFMTTFTEAAVLIPLVVKNKELELLFEVRAGNLKWQPKDVCFPGGKIDKTDKDALSAALREAEEELALKNEDICTVAKLPIAVYPIGMIIHPFVVSINNLESLKLSPREVAECFTVPLSFFMKNAPCKASGELGVRLGQDVPYHLLPADFSKDWRSTKKYDLFFYQYGKYVIWGITADLIYRFINFIK